VNLFEQIVEVYLGNLYGEGSRILKLKAVSAGVRAVNGVRRLLFLQYCLMICCFLFAATLFASAWLVLGHLSRGEPIVFDLQLKVLCTASVALGFLLYYTVREATWVKALDLERNIDELLGVQQAASVYPIGPSRAELVSLIDEALEKKLSANHQRPRRSKNGS
jgi:hypothetical protein